MQIIVMEDKPSMGFSLVELIITISVLAILVTVAAPAFIDMLKNRRLQGAVETLYSDLQLARLEANKRSDKISIYFDSDQWCYGLNDEVGTCDCTVASGLGTGNCEIGEGDGIDNNEFSRVVQGSDFNGISISKNGSQGTTFKSSFSHIRGTASSISINLTTDNSSTRQVIISSQGRIKLAK